MQHYRWIPETLCWVKEVNGKRLCAVWVQKYENLKKKKQCIWKKNRLADASSLEKGEVLTITYWKSRSSELLSFCSTGGFCPPRAHLRTPALPLKGIPPQSNSLPATVPTMGCSRSKTLRAHPPPPRVSEKMILERWEYQTTLPAS